MSSSPPLPGRTGSKNVVAMRVGMTALRMTTVPGRPRPLAHHLGEGPQVADRAEGAERHDRGQPDELAPWASE